MRLMSLIKMKTNLVNKILQIKFIPALLFFLIIAASVSANEVIKLNQFNNYLKQARDLNTSNKPQEALKVLQQAKEKINTTLLAKVFKNKEIKQTEKEIEGMKQLVEKKIKKVAMENIPTLIGTTTNPSSISSITLNQNSFPTTNPQPTATSLLPIPTKIDWEQFNKKLNESLKEVKNIVEPTYNYDSYYPIILSFSDNYGQINKNSAFNKYPYSSLPDVTVKIGDIIRCKVEVSEPKGRQILYHFFSNSTPFNKQVSYNENGEQKFISNSEIEYTVTEEDLKSVGGQRFEIHAAIKSDKEYLRIPSQGYDDTIELHYNILRPED